MAKLKKILIRCWVERTSLRLDLSPLDLRSLDLHWALVNRKGNIRMCELWISPFQDPCWVGSWTGLKETWLRFLLVLLSSFPFSFFSPLLLCSILVALSGDTLFCWFHILFFVSLSSSNSFFFPSSAFFKFYVFSCLQSDNQWIAKTKKSSTMN